MAWTQAARDAAALTRKAHKGVKAVVPLGAMKHIVQRPKQVLLVGVGRNNKTISKGEQTNHSAYRQELGSFKMTPAKKRRK